MCYISNGSNTTATNINRKGDVEFNSISVVYASVYIYIYNVNSNDESTTHSFYHDIH